MQKFYHHHHRGSNRKHHVFRRPTPLPSAAAAAASVRFPSPPPTKATAANPHRLGLPLTRCAYPSFRAREPPRGPIRAAASLCALLGAIPSDFGARWRCLSEISEDEARLAKLPYHVIQAVTASEDLRFFHHPGVDPFGVARAVVYFPNGGGGSTITQQIYWGHGIYGIQSASLLYFGKHPSLLTVAESALLAGILPAPEILSPLTSPSRDGLVLEFLCQCKGLMLAWSST